MRFINRIFAPRLGQRVENQTLLPDFERLAEGLPLPPEQRQELLSFIRFQLVGERSRYSLIPDWKALDRFQSRAAAFEHGAESALDALAEEIVPAAEAAGIGFDAVLCTTATGNLMPGLSYRLSRRLGALVRPDSMLLDLANVGCTGSAKLLNVAQSLDPSVRHILAAAVEVPSTLVDFRDTTFDRWQGNCTFGDGAAAAWIASDPAPGALALESIRYRQMSDRGHDLIRWKYGDYYAFALRNVKTFDADVRHLVVEALQDVPAEWVQERHWAIHPAGIALLVRISRKLGIPQEAVQPSIAHYREHSNMSSASLLHIIRDVAAGMAPGAGLNLLTMGAGFNVIYGRLTRTP